MNETMNICCCCDREIPPARQSIFFQDQNGKWQAACLFCHFNVLKAEYIDSEAEPLQTAFLNYLCAAMDPCPKCGETECEGDFDEDDENIEFTCDKCGTIRIQRIGWGNDHD